MSKSIAHRFWAKVHKTDTCWLWTGAKDSHGYGHLKHGGKTKMCHRLAWGLFTGKEPGDLWVLHKCDTPSCVNPEHLFLGTHSDNMLDMQAKGRGRDQKGIKSNFAKLTEEQVRAIRATKGVSLRDTGKEFGVSDTTVWHVLHRNTWRHI